MGAFAFRRREIDNNGIIEYNWVYKVGWKMINYEYKVDIS